MAPCLPNSLRTHQVQQRVADGEREEIVDDVEHDEFAHLAPDFGFVGGTDMQQQRIQHLAGILAGEDEIWQFRVRGLETLGMRYSNMLKDLGTQLFVI